MLRPSPTSSFAVLATALTLGANARAVSAAEDWAASIGWPPLDYNQAQYWACGAQEDDLCDADLRHVTEHPDLSVQVRFGSFADGAEPAIDCFYVYPTVHLAGAVRNVDPVLDDMVASTVQVQAAPFGDACRVFAPVYRQISLPAYNDPSGPLLLQNALADVMAAFEHYLANWNDGRPFVVMGHSQGTQLITYLLHRYFDGAAAVTEVPGSETQADLRARLVAGLAIGGNVIVPSGEVAGSSFADLPLCSAREQYGCIVAFRTFTEGYPGVPSSGGGEDMDAHFAPLGFLHRGWAPGDSLACTNPAWLQLGPEHRAVLPCNRLNDVTSSPNLRVLSQSEEVRRARCTITDTCSLDNAVCSDDSDCLDEHRIWPTRYTATCRESGGNQGLYIGIHRPVLPAVDSRDDVFNTCLQRNADMGLHVSDYKLTLGDLRELVKAKAAAFIAAGNDAGAAIDAAAHDAAAPDATAPDAAAQDAAIPDAAAQDAAAPDTAVPDAAGAEAGLPDASSPEAASAESGLPDGARLDTSEAVEAGAQDTGLADASAVDGGSRAPDPGCGCSSNGSTAPSAWAALLVGPGLARVRARSRRRRLESECS